MKLKGLIIFGLITVSLLPVYMLYKWLERVIKPRSSARRFLAWLVAVLALVFLYTFLLVLVIRLLFPGA